MTWLLLLLYGAVGAGCYWCLSDNGNPRVNNAMLSVAWPVVIAGILWLFWSWEK